MAQSQLHIKRNGLLGCFSLDPFLAFSLSMARSTFLPSNSSIHEWLNYPNETIDIRPCNLNNAEVACAHVCNNVTYMLYAQSTNLVTCGLWTNLAIAGSDYDNNVILHPVDSSLIQDLSSVFEEVNLNTTDLQNARNYADTITNSFLTIYQLVKASSFADNGNVPVACSKECLFPFTSALVGGGGSSLWDCVQTICSPLTLDPDLAGIGVR